MSDKTLEGQGNTIPENKEGQPKEGEGEKTPQTPSKEIEEGKQTPTQLTKPVPDEYKLKLPKDSLLKEERIQEVVDFAKANKLSNAEAQLILENESDSVASYAENQKTVVDDQIKNWTEEIKADKELGGDDFNKNAELTKRVIERFGNEALIKDLEESGLGNHPEFFRFALKIGQAMSNDEFVQGGQPGGKSKKTNSEIFYTANKK